MGSDGELENARHILQWIEKTTQDVFTKRDAHKAMQARFKKADDLEPALKILMEHGYIRQVDRDETKGPGRPPSPSFEVNPLGQKLQ